MEVLQNQTEEKEETDLQSQAVSAESILKWKQEQYILYTAYGGLIPDEDNEKVGLTMNATVFAQRLGVARQTLYDWRKSIPNFWDRVAEARKQIGGADRLAKVWNGVYLKAVAGNAEAAKLYLANFDPNFHMPAQKVEVEAGDSLVEAIGIARSRRAVIEAEVVDESNNPA